jgi:PIN domain nuclease of toxin-antitoxin system
LGGRAVLSVMMHTPWKRSFETVPPLQRCSFVSLAESWGAMVRQNISARIGESKTTEAADAA